jgi:taurine dioxygenase
MPTIAREVIKLSPALGAEVRGVDLSQPMDEATLKFVTDAWHDSLVIVFRGQSIDAHQQVAFGSRFGELSPAQTANRVRKTEHPAIMYISNRMENGKFIDQLPAGEMQFHIDQCYIEVPSKATMLYSMAIPGSGGDTLFSNHYLAYECLSQQVKDRIAGRKVVNVYDYDNASTTKSDKVSDTAPRYSHPIVCVHPGTGRKYIYVNRLMSLSIEGLEKAESDDLLETMFEAIERPEHVWAHSWKVGDVLMWDNRCTSHARRDFPVEELRQMRRLTIRGEKPRMAA